MMLQIDPSRARAISDEAADTVNIIRYEDPNDNLERDVDMMLNDDGDRIIHYTHGSPMDSTASIEIPTELIRRAGQAMWNPSWRSSGKGVAVAVVGVVVRWVKQKRIMSKMRNVQFVVIVHQIVSFYPVDIVHNVGNVQGELYMPKIDIVIKIIIQIVIVVMPFRIHVRSCVYM